MATTITFTDGTGAASLTNGKSSGADRFASWVPRKMPIGPKAPALASGQVFRWVHRTDYTARFELRHIPNSSLDVAIRLIAHLEGGGTCAVNTGDSAARSYINCGVAPGADLSGAITFGDAAFIEYSLTLELINLSFAPMLCVY